MALAWDKTKPSGATKIKDSDNEIRDNQAALEEAIGASGGSLVHVIRSATLVVAANDASTYSKLQADYVCDGTADDVQIQAAVDALSSGKGIVYLTEGTFVLASAISAPNNIIIWGAGRGTEIKIGDDTNINAIEVGGSAITRSYVIIGNLFINGNKANQSSAGIGIWMRRVKKCKIIGCWIEDCYLQGIYADSYDTVSLDNLLILNNFISNSNLANIELADPGYVIGIFNCVIDGNYSYNAGKEGIEIQGELSRGNIISNNRVIDATEEGIDLDKGCNGCTCKGNYVSGSGVLAGIVVEEGGSGDTAKRNIIENNIITGGTVAGIKLATAEGNIVRGNVIFATGGTNTNGIELDSASHHNDIDGNHIHDEYNGIQVLGDYNKIHDNYLHDNDFDGVQIVSGAIGNSVKNNYPYLNYSSGISTEGNYTDIQGNQCISNDTRDVSYAAGIKVNADECMIINNVCRDDQGSKTQAYGILISGGNDNVMRGNKLTGNKTGAYSDSGTRTIIEHNITGATEYTASGALAIQDFVKLNKSDGVLAMTLANPGQAGIFMTITQIDSGTQGHTVTTATGGGFDGTNNRATFNAQYETLVLISVSSTRWVIVENIGGVGLSAV